MKLRVIGTGAVMAMSLGVVAATPATSYAAGCYTGCHTSTPKTAGGTPAVADGTPDGAATATQAHALAFTGANVLLPTGIGGGAILVGGAFMYVGRRRRYSSAR
jgi:uncharacterized transporter YbjL